MGLDYKIIFVSNEDPQYPVGNLRDYNDKEAVWRIAQQQTGLDSNEAYFQIEFERPSKIENICLVNAGSQYVEIQVSQAQAENKDEGFEGLLPRSTVVPVHAHSFSQSSFVRKFDSSSFNSDQLEKEWIRLKVKCEGPISGEAFGLSFFGVNLTDQEFQQVQQYYQPKPAVPAPVQPVPAVAPVASAPFAPIPVTGAAPSAAIAGQPQAEAAPAPKKPRGKAVAKILLGVTLAISGINNPERTQLRDFATRLGAKYTSEWQRGVNTHLVCALLNTPKYNAARKDPGVSIVTKEWLHTCWKEKRRMPESDFKFGEDAGNNNANKPGVAPEDYLSGPSEEEWEEEEEDEEEEPDVDDDADEWEDDDGGDDDEFDEEEDSEDDSKKRRRSSRPKPVPSRKSSRRASSGRAASKKRR